MENSNSFSESIERLPLDDYFKNALAFSLPRLKPTCIPNSEYKCSRQCYICKEQRLKKPKYTLIPARDMVAMLSGDFDNILMGWYCIEKTRIQSNISLKLPAIYTAKFLPL